ncbi:MAG: 1-acyl-sn-glycerol-3-phosphate acyltransferase [Anaerolineae bacterium]|jgi:1-acyl-sn-glycerol-3-phosphate acyltransferase|nr:1-acyl-sn-glycerol-3-phosphate acyltransferase [Anaerolineae bacterium]
MKWLEQLALILLRPPLLLLWRLMGWRLEGQLPDLDKYIILAVPHTSFWDYFHTLMAAAQMRRLPHTTTKHTLFWFPLGLFLRATGCIPINREQALNMVDTLSEMIAREPRFVLVFTPEGTRKKTRYWKSGFYYTALKAGVPIMCCAIDYQRKWIKAGPLIHPTGDIIVDFESIKAFYQQHGRNGKFPDQVSDLALKERRYDPLQRDDAPALES